MTKLPFSLSMLAAISLVAAVMLIFWHQPSPSTTNPVVTTNVHQIATPTVNTNTTADVPMILTNVHTSTPPSINANAVTASPKPMVVVPIADFFNRITKKPFGIYITPKSSPVQPEKFTGYHTGADAETTAAEKEADIPIHAIAVGTVVFAGHVNGYGGVIMIRHQVSGETVTALYGHLRISSFKIKKGDGVKVNDIIGLLGTGYSSETDGERKHLHFGLIKGAAINYKGYVQTKSALSAWEDPAIWLPADGG